MIALAAREDGAARYVVTSGMLTAGRKATLGAPLICRSQVRIPPIMSVHHPYTTEGWYGKVRVRLRRNRFIYTYL